MYIASISFAASERDASVTDQSNVTHTASAEQAASNDAWSSISVTICTDASDEYHFSRGMQHHTEHAAGARHVCKRSWLISCNAVFKKLMQPMLETKSSLL